MLIRTAAARWEGNLKEGKGNIRLGSGAYDGPYSFNSRFEQGTGTNPEEMLGGAHAGCFTMALSLGLTTAGHPPTSLETTAKVHLARVSEVLTITAIELITEGRVPGISAAEFERLAQDAKRNCILSRAISAPISLKATLVT
ncbi:MAG: OsmC family protein [Gemmatimonadales bacterium]|nr:OsmC family protein [Gemmatimonadales bacterium]